jgi:hypothetical protein
MKTIAAKEEDNLANGALKAVIIYDDVGYAARAAVSLERAASGADEAMKCDFKLWRLDALRQPTLAAITIAVAVEADLIVFALSKTHPPEALLNWLELWSANRRITDVAVTLLGPEADTATALRNELVGFARRRGLVFLDTRETWADEGAASDTHVQPPWQPPDAHALLPSLEPAPAEMHWGIND